MLVKLNEENHGEFVEFVQKLLNSLSEIYSYGMEDLVEEYMNIPVEQYPYLSTWPSEIDYEDAELSMMVGRYLSYINKPINELGEIFVVFNDDEEIVGFFHAFNMFNTKVFYFDFDDACDGEDGEKEENVRECFTSLVSKFPTAHFLLPDEEYWYVHQMYEELNILQVESGPVLIEDDDELNYPSLWSIYAVNGGDEMVQNLEKLQYPGYENFNINDVMFRVMDADELNNFMLSNEGWSNQLPNWKTSRDLGYIPGFHCYSFPQIDEEKSFYNVKYLCAIYQNHIVGILTFGQENEAQDYETIFMMEISHLYRGKGLAKALVSNLEPHLNSGVSEVHLIQKKKTKREKNLEKRKDGSVFYPFAANTVKSLFETAIKDKEFVITEN